MPSRACARGRRASPARALINVTYVIDEGPRIYIERINIIGNLRTRDYVIRREFRLAEGDAYNPLMVDKAKKRLQQLGFFKTVDDQAPRRAPRPTASSSTSSWSSSRPASCRSAPATRPAKA